MKRIIVYSFLIIVFTFLGIVGMKNQPKELPNAEILNTPYYKYNINNDKYDEFRIMKNQILYSGEELELNNCKDYMYEKNTGIVKMDCGRSFRIISPSNDILVISTNNTNYYYFKDKNLSFSKEFENHFGMSLEEYQLKASDKINKIKIDLSKFNELLVLPEINYIYTKTNNCSFKCNIFENNFDKIYTNLNYVEEEIIKTQVSNFENLYQNSDSPLIIEISNNEIKNIKEIEINGFNIDNKKGENNENNE